MGGIREFDYAGLPFEEIAKLYREGWGWKGIARHFGAPDHHTLRKHTLRHKPELEEAERDHPQAQRARRAREKSAAAPTAARRGQWSGGRP